MSVSVLDFGAYRKKAREVVFADETEFQNSISGYVNEDAFVSATPYDPLFCCSPTAAPFLIYRGKVLDVLIFTEVP